MTPSQAIERLQAEDMTEAAIGAAVGVHQSTINRIRSGREPRWSLGNALITLALVPRRRRSRKS